MTTASVRDLRNHFADLSARLEAGETVHILKNGRPFARLVPEPKSGSFLGSTPSSTPLPLDLDEPLEEVWEASK